MNAINVLGTELVPCSYDPITGYFRDGCCNTEESDTGSHLVCVKVTQDFLTFSSARGNDLVTPQPQHRFAGLKPGDRWWPVRQPLAGGAGGRLCATGHSGVHPLQRPRICHHGATGKIPVSARHALNGALCTVIRPGQRRGTATIMSFAEGWMSGLSHTPGKRAWGYSHRGFESRLFRQNWSGNSPKPVRSQDP
jgi:uncharacterized protein (DUF2237 family)